MKNYLKSNKIILPGVGSFKKAVNNLIDKNLDQILEEAVNKRKIDILGICLGMQLLAQTSSEDGINNGLGFIQGHEINLNQKT